MISFLKKKKKTITVCDFETGGLNPNKHAITEVAMLNFDMETLKVNWEYQAYIQTYHNLEVSKSSLEKSLVSQNDIDNGKSLKVVLSDMIKLFQQAKKIDSQGTIMLGHNFVKFDRIFLEKMFELEGMNVYDYIHGSIIDTLPIAQSKWIGKSNGFSLKSCCNKIGYDLKYAHSALHDVRANFELWKILKP